GHRPETLNDLEIDLSSYLNGHRKAHVRIYDPWKNRWQDKSIESGRINLESFNRSVVIRVD
ncbi:MAG: hypothetical protein RQ760_17110, partial [Sedimentisphaerales bacterium]|nr:hypothetical protein [Sedimentisphaerales bacterium]